MVCEMSTIDAMHVGSRRVSRRGTPGESFFGPVPAPTRYRSMNLRQEERHENGSG
jgi:hypothetical protein